MGNIALIDGFKYSLIKTGLVPVDYYFQSFNDDPITIDFSHHKTCALLSEEAYNFDKDWAADRVNGYLRVKEYDTNNSKTGFQGCVFANDKVVIISYRGTDDKGEDLANDFQMFLGRCPSQYDDALALYDRVKKDERFKDKKIFLTGHSLGGSLAQLVSSTPRVQECSEGVTAITFNPYGQGALISESSGDFTDYNNSTNYVISDDFVGTSRKHPGKVASVSISPKNGVSFTGSHGIECFVENEQQFKSAYDATKDNSFTLSSKQPESENPGFFSSLCSHIGEFLNNCGRAIASFFGFENDNDSRSRLA